MSVEAVSRGPGCSVPTAGTAQWSSAAAGLFLMIGEDLERFGEGETLRGIYSCGSSADAGGSFENDTLPLCRCFVGASSVAGGCASAADGALLVSPRLLQPLEGPRQHGRRVRPLVVHHCLMRLFGR